MNCVEARVLVHGHLDAELDPAHDLEVQRHLGECPLCAREYSSARALSARLSGGELRFTAPDRLRDRIRSAMPSEAPARPAQRSSIERRLRRILPIAIPLALAAGLLIWINPMLRAPSPDDLVEHEVVASHVRSLMASHLTDVTSSDQHTVKPYFEGKLDFSPSVADFGAQGFELMGGRLDYLDQRPVAALIYRHGKHYINVFIWPEKENSSAQARDDQIQGYNLTHFTRDRMDYWVVSNLNRTELDKLVALLRG